MGSGDALPTSELDIKGTYILAASGANAKAIAPEGERHTAFTGSLPRLLTSGIEGNREFLCVSDLYRNLREDLIARSLPEPRQRPVDSIDMLAFARNPRRRADDAVSLGTS